MRLKPYASGVATLKANSIRTVQSHNNVIRGVRRYPHDPLPKKYVDIRRRVLCGLSYPLIRSSPHHQRLSTDSLLLDKMSDDEVDPELLELLRQHLAGGPKIQEEADTGVLAGAEHVYDHGIDIAIDMRASKAAAESIYEQMQTRKYSTETWSEHELHPKAKDAGTVAFIFTMDLLNFSFWSTLPEDERFAVEYQGKRWTGYWSLVAALQRALEEG